MATVFVGTLLTYLVVTAVPALAVSSCSNDAAVTGDVNHMVVNVGTDDTVVIRNTGIVQNLGTIEISQNGGAFAACATGDSLAATVDWIEVLGSDAGNEKFTIFNPTVFGAENTTVSLGNGTDSLTWEFGALASPATADPDPANAVARIGQSGTVGVGDFDNNGIADLRVDNAETQTLNGGTANDTLDAGNVAGIAGFDFATVAGTADAIPASAAGASSSANLTLNGGSGDDSLVSGNGNDNFQGGAGADGVSYVAATGAVAVDLTLATGTGMGSDTLADVQNATGGPFNDTITGNALNNVLNGGDGNDVLDALAGDDTMNGNAGNDTFNEGAAANGADTISGGLNTGAGDTLNYGARTTALVVRPGAGPVSGADANADGDAADATDERDTVTADIENFVLGSAADRFVGSGNAEFITPGAGNDNIDGGVAGEAACTDVIDESDQTGPAAFNLPAGTATLGTQVDTFTNIEGVSGTEGDDTVVWDGVTPAGIPAGVLHGAFGIIGGAGVDTVNASSATRAVTLDLVQLFTACGGAAANADLENATGGSGADTLVGNILNNVLLGNDGNDTITAGAGNDFVEGGLGNDALTSGGGADTLSYLNAPSGVVVDNQVGFALGGDGDDTLTGVFPIILGSDFDDQIIAGQTAGDVNQRIRGRGGNDLITGSNSSDTLAGGGGNDVIRGGGGDDIVRGAAGNDRLFGSSGDDFLFGGRGFDVGRGGAGDDLCRGVEDRRSC